MSQTQDISMVSGYAHTSLSRFRRDSNWRVCVYAFCGADACLSPEPKIIQNRLLVEEKSSPAWRNISEPKSWYFYSKMINYYWKSFYFLKHFQQNHRFSGSETFLHAEANFSSTNNRFLLIFCSGESHASAPYNAYAHTLQFEFLRKWYNDVWA